MGLLLPTRRHSIVGGLAMIAIAETLSLARLALEERLMAKALN